MDHPGLYKSQGHIAQAQFLALVDRGDLLSQLKMLVQGFHALPGGYYLFRSGDFDHLRQ